MSIQQMIIAAIARMKVSTGITYLLNAPFTADNQTFSNAQVLDTAAEGVTTGSLTVVDTGAGAVEILSNQLKITGSGTLDETGVYQTAGETKSLGKTAFITVTHDTDVNAYFGYNKDADVVTGDLLGLRLSDTDKIYVTADTEASPALEIGAVVDETDYQTAFVMGGFDTNGVPYKSGDTAADFTYGLSYFVKGGTFTNWTLMWSGISDVNTPLYMTAGAHNAAVALYDNMLITDYDFSAVLQPTVLDTFTGTNGDDLGTHAMDVDPDTNDWTEQVGSWEIQSNKGVTTGGAGIADFDAGIADIVLTATITMPGSGTTAGGIVLRAGDYTGASEDYWYIKCTPGTAGNDFEIIEYVAGTPTSRAAADADFGVGSDVVITVIADGSTITAFADGADKITYASATSGQTLTQHGIRDEGIANMAFDQISIHPRTSATYETTFAAGTLEL